ncbi:hypothetical protein LK09_01515 [Microbacterium mangrovi]|uniref:Ribonuclease VapC n=1 Tax=Microbacterium mangrovi TaxID=1348253 RepID=A0A0B2A901_9MICO|nr:type II toxin-antitoxin system VapC family toxin [Microbacterium mangrovi]KHL00049.1 hypothetical protein LK09_01515 [Microbacterium mangrovi]
MAGLSVGGVVPRSAVVDAGVLIAFLDPDDAHHDWAVRVVRTLGPGQARITALTLAEAMVHPAMAGRAEEARAGVRSLGVDVLPLTDDDVLPLAGLRASSRLRMPDAVVLHAAIRASAAVATTDRSLARSAVGAGLPLYAPFRVLAPG